MASFVYLEVLFSYIGNGTEWSAIWSEITNVISKSNKYAAQVWFEITNMISDQTCTTQSSITTSLYPFWKRKIQLLVYIRFFSLHKCYVDPAVNFFVKSDKIYFPFSSNLISVFKQTILV